LLLLLVLLLFSWLFMMNLPLLYQLLLLLLIFLGLFHLMELKQAYKKAYNILIVRLTEVEKKRKIHENCSVVEA